MIKLIDFILELFRDEDHAHAFVTNPEQALAAAGLSNVTPAQLQSVAATAVPSLAMGGDGDAVAGLQQAVSGYWASPAAPIGPDLAGDNGFLSPTANIQNDHSLSFGLGDVTLGDKTSARGDGAVAVGGANHGDIISGDGAVLGTGNKVDNGDVHAGAGSTVAVGDGNDTLSSHGGTVIQTSGQGTTTSSASNTTSVDNSTHVTHTTTIDDSQHDSHDVSVHSAPVIDSSVHSSAVFDTSMHDSSLHDSSIHETTHHVSGLDAHLGF